jgi:hypothetical protein
MAIKLHRCGNMWAKFGRHPCWAVQKALDDEGIEYEIVKESWPSRKGRTAVIAGTGQSGLPAIELENGAWYREDSADMVKAIRNGKFGAPAAPSAPAAADPAD